MITLHFLLESPEKLTAPTENTQDTESVKMCLEVNILLQWMVSVAVNFFAFVVALEVSPGAWE